MSSQFKKWLIAAAMAVSLPAVSLAAPGGFGFDKNRLVIEDGHTSGSFSLRNANETGLLIRAHVEDFNQVLTQQAQARPRLFQVRGGGTGRVRVDVNPKGLPTDRETQFWLYTKAFPAIDLKKEQENQIQINFVTRLKVFYRPKGIKVKVEEAVRDLNWKREDGRLVAENNSPLNVTIVSITQNGKRQSVSHVIKPFSRWVTNTKAAPGHMKWQSINDQGGVIEYEGTLR